MPEPDSTGNSAGLQLVNPAIRLKLTVPAVDATHKLAHFNSKTGIGVELSTK